jgi:hypothetical protein
MNEVAILLLMLQINYCHSNYFNAIANSVREATALYCFQSFFWPKRINCKNKPRDRDRMQYRSAHAIVCGVAFSSRIVRPVARI